jgi:hypothetical protein
LGIVFLVGDAADVFEPQFASSVAAELRARYPAAAAGGEAYRSDEIEAQAWRELQQRTGALAPQVSRMEAYQAVWAPGGPSPIAAVPIANAGDPLHVGSLEKLVEELSVFASANSLPTDDIELMQLAAKYLEDDALFDRDLDIQLYVQLMLSARQASARRQPLWIVL